MPNSLRPLHMCTQLVSNIVCATAGKSDSSRKQQLQGIVVSERTTRDGEKTMCEVLYINGWVVWHDKKSFAAQQQANNRRATLTIFNGLSEMIQNTQEYIMSGGDPQGIPTIPMVWWVQSMDVFRQLLHRGDKRSPNAQTYTQRAQELVDCMTAVYKGL